MLGPPTSPPFPYTTLFRSEIPPRPRDARPQVKYLPMHRDPRKRAARYATYVSTTQVQHIVPVFCALAGLLDDRVGSLCSDGPELEQVRIRALGSGVSLVPR